MMVITGHVIGVYIYIYLDVCDDDDPDSDAVICWCTLLSYIL